MIGCSCGRKGDIRANPLLRLPAAQQKWDTNVGNTSTGRLPEAAPTLDYLATHYLYTCGSEICSIARFCGATISGRAGSSGTLIISDILVRRERRGRNSLLQRSSNHYHTSIDAYKNFSNSTIQTSKATTICRMRSYVFALIGLMATTIAYPTIESVSLLIAEPRYCQKLNTMKKRGDETPEVGITGPGRLIEAVAIKAARSDGSPDSNLAHALKRAEEQPEYAVRASGQLVDEIQV